MSLGEALGRSLGVPGVLGRSWESLRRCWGGPWGSLGVPGGCLEDHWEVLGRSWGSLRGPWGPLGGSMGGPWKVFGSPRGSLGLLGGPLGGSFGFLGEPRCIGFGKVLRLATGSILLEGFVAADGIPMLRAWGSLRDPGAPWGVPGRSLGILGRSLGALGDPWGIPGRSLGDPGCSLALPGWFLGGLQMLPGRLLVAQGRSKKR